MHLMKYNIVPRELVMEKFNTAKIVFYNYNDANICLDKMERRSIEDKEKVTAYIEERFTKCRGVITDWEQSIDKLIEIITDKRGILRIDRMKRKR